MLKHLAVGSHLLLLYNLYVVAQVFYHMHNTTDDRHEVIHDYRKNYTGESLTP